MQEMSKGLNEKKTWFYFVMYWNIQSEDFDLKRAR